MRSLDGFSQRWCWRQTRRLLLVLLLLGPLGAEVRGADGTRRDDAYHFADYEGGPHALSYTEWWYFNLIDPASGIQLAVAYAILDPANLSGFGTASVAAIAYTPESAFTETSVYPHTSFFASPDQADVIIAGGDTAALNYVQVLSDDVYHVVGTVDQEHDVSWDLLYIRRAAPWFASDREHVGVFPWEEMSWLQYMPLASVTGHVVIDGRQYRVTNARGYHDHNWGVWIPFTVAWNWAQYSEPGFNFSIGDFRGSMAGVASIESFGERTIFTKDQYLLVHDTWRYDVVNQLWFPMNTWLYAQNDEHTLIVRLRADDTVPVLPPPHIPLPLVPVIYEQTADFLGWLWEKNQAGEWELTRRFRGDGFKEYTGITVPHPP